MIIKKYKVKELNRLKKEYMYMVTGILSIIWSFILSIAMFKAYVNIANNCNTMKLVIVFNIITVLIGILVWNIRKKEREKSIDEEVDESEDSKDD